ncbi:MAG TPA: hypothetical protein VEI57_13425 [Nitrospirota bacterium]|nr:hypothetical protein [Nitrospirota bacterium]
MLSAKRQLASGNNRIITTPLLIPSFSSKGFPDLADKFAIVVEVITDAVLVSAYAFFYRLSIVGTKQVKTMI